MATQTWRHVELGLARARSLNRWLLGGALAALVLVLVTGGWLVVRWLDEESRIQPGVQVAGFNVGGMMPGEAEQAISAHFAAVLDTPVDLRLGEQVWTYPARDLGLGLDTAAMSQAAYNAGRNGLPLTATLPLSFSHDKAQAQ